MEFVFKVDTEVKKEYLDTKPTGTAESESFVLRSMDEYEDLIDKSVYNMNHAELREMIAMKFRNSSIKAILKDVSIIKTYIYFCINKKIVPHGENRLATFTASEAKDFVHKQALLNKYITREKLREYQNILNNEQDQGLLELSYIGVRGRTVKGATYEEIINLSIDDVDEENCMLTLTQNNGKHRRMKVDTHIIELIKDVYNQEFYVENNGEMTANIRLSKPRETVINKVENFIFRVPGKKKFQKFTPNLLNSRMSRIQNFLDNPYITYTSLYQSGMLEMAFDIYRENGDVTKEDYIDICERYNYGSGDPDKYWHVVKSLFEQYKELLIK